MAGELLIQNGSKAYIPVVEDEIEWSTERAGVARKTDIQSASGQQIGYYRRQCSALPMEWQQCFLRVHFLKENVERPGDYRDRI